MKSYDIKRNHAGTYFLVESEDGSISTISLMHIDTILKVMRLEGSKYYKPFLNFIMCMTKSCAYATRNDNTSKRLSSLYDLRAKGILFQNNWYNNFPEIVHELSTIIGLHYGGVHVSQQSRDFVIRKTEEVLKKTKKGKVLKKESN